MKVTIYRDIIPLAYGLAVVGDSAFEPSIEVTQKFYNKCTDIEMAFFEIQDKLEKLYIEARKKKGFSGSPKKN